MLYVVLRPFRSRGQQYAPGDILKSPGHIVSFRSRITAGDVLKVTVVDDSMKSTLTFWSKRTNVNLLGKVTQELAKVVETPKEIEQPKVEVPKPATPVIKPATPVAKPVTPVAKPVK